MGKSKENPKAHVVSMRLTDDEFALVELEAKRRNIPISEVLRDALHVSWVGHSCSCKGAA